MSVWSLQWPCDSDISLCAGLFSAQRNVVARRELDVCLLPVRAASAARAVTLQLALLVQHTHLRDLYTEQHLHGILHFALGGVRQHLEHMLAHAVGRQSGLFRHVRGKQDFHQPLLTHASHASTRLSAAFVMTTLSNPIRFTGFRPATAV